MKKRETTNLVYKIYCIDCDASYEIDKEIIGQENQGTLKLGLHDTDCVCAGVRNKVYTFCPCGRMSDIRANKSMPTSILSVSCPALHQA